MFMDSYPHEVRINNIGIPKSKLYDKILKDANIDFVSQRILCDRDNPIINEHGNYNRDTIFYFTSEDDAVQAKLLL